MKHNAKIIDNIRQDMQAIKANTDTLHIILYLLFSYHKRPLILLRLLSLEGWGNKIFRKLVSLRLRAKYQIECSCQSIGAPIRIPHPRGIILSAKSIGSNCFIGPYVTIGGNNQKSRPDPYNNNSMIKTPEICDNVQILQGAVVAGPIIIGNDVIIGANTTVTRDVPPHTLLYSSSQISRKRVTVLGWKGPFIKE